MGLAVEERKGRWRLADELEPTLRAMGKRGDIIATLDREVRARELAALPADYAIYDSARTDAQPIVGRIAARGLSDEQVGREYLIVDGIDGRVHYVEIGLSGDEHGREGAIVRINPTPVTVRDVDRTVAEIAGANGGRYGEEIHFRHDPTASERFVQTHVRRLEAILRSTRGVERELDGTWRIAADHVERALEYERRRAAREPVQIRPLAAMALEQMPVHDGITWLDEDGSLADAHGPGGSFGSKVADAMRRRQQWLVEQALADKPDRLDILRRRELQRIVGQLSRELGAPFVEAESGLPVEGTYRRSVQVGTMRMAVIENSREFTLVPWRPVLERQIGNELSGMMRGRDVSWTFGRQRSGPEI
jgi:hypothetical protein